MTSSLSIAVRFHDGRYYGREDGFNRTEGWPPSPGRLFQALVASAARGATLLAEDGRAFKWLESLDPPRIAAPAARRGDAVKLFVPNNDLDAVGPERVSEIRVGKQWRPYFFDQNEAVLYVWDFESGLPQARQVCAIASRLYQLGRGIDLAWANGRVLGEGEADGLLEAHPGTVRTPRSGGDTPVPRPGTLDSLLERYRRKRSRLTTDDTGRRSRQLFAQPPKASFRHTGYDSPPRYLHFELRGSKNEFRACPLGDATPLLVGLRDAAARRLQEFLPSQSALLERLIIGRGAGPEDLPQRTRMLPIPSIGAEHTDPSIRRILIEIPPDCPIRVDDLKWGFSGLNPHDPQSGEAWSGNLVQTDDARMADRFMKPSRTFRTMTPAVLPKAQRRRLKVAEQKSARERRNEDTSACNAVVQALRHAGVRARPSYIHVQREPFQRRGVRAEMFAVGARFSKHALWHVELRFHEPVSGPLVIGDGRFCGLGLMEPIATDPRIVAFTLKRRVDSGHGPILVHHLRRALMHLARDDSGRVGRLFSGHESDGQSDSRGHHDHVFLAADDGGVGDGSVGRLIVVSPWAADRRAKRRPVRVFDEVTQKLTELRAGSVGRFDRLAAEFLEDGDPLIGPALTWISKTPYVASRNLKKRNGLAEFVKADLVAECSRRGLPKPNQIDLSDLLVGPRGGNPTGQVTLHFAVAVRGPLLLGRDSHRGGGLFHAVK